MQVDDTIQQLVNGCRVLAEQDIIDAYGHLSARVPGRDDVFLISRAMSPALVSPQDWVVMDFEGKVVQGNGFPNQEWPIHACVYQARPDVGSVLHSHCTWSRVWSLSPVKLRGVLMGQAHEWNGGLAVYRDAGLIRDKQRGEKMVSLLGKSTAMLLRGHGDVVCDRDVTSTVMRSVTLKQNAEVLHHVLALGTPDYWSLQEAEGWAEPIQQGRSPEHNAALRARLFDYYLARIDGRLAKLIHPEVGS